MAIWGHQDLSEAAAMAEQIIHDGGAVTTPNQKKKWLLTEPRHTHMERMPLPTATAPITRAGCSAKYLSRRPTACR